MSFKLRKPIVITVNTVNEQTTVSEAINDVHLPTTTTTIDALPLNRTPSNQRSFIPSTFNVSSPSSISTSVSPASSGGTHSYRFFGSKKSKSQLRKSISMVNVRWNDYEVFAHNSGYNNNLKNNLELMSTNKANTPNEVTSSLSFGIASNGGSLATNNTVGDKSGLIYKGSMRKWRSFSSLYDKNSETSGIKIEPTLRDIREENIEDFKKKNIRNLREKKHLEIVKGSKSDRSLSSGAGRRAENDKEDISEDPSVKSNVRAIYEYYHITSPKGDVISDQFCGVADRYGFIIIEEEEKCELLGLTPHEIRFEKKEAQRSEKWVKWVSASKFVKKSGNFGITSYVFPWDTKFQNRIYKGIPDSWRQPVWHFLLTNGGAESEFDDNLIRTYNTLLTLPSQHERQIDLDIPRTLNSHIMFRTRYGPGQRALFNVLRTFSNYDKQVGYCQGMTNIVAILLMYYAEESAFVMLTKLFTRCNLHNLYIPGFPALLESFYVQEKLMTLYAPKISENFVSIVFLRFLVLLYLTAYATRWYITLFAGDVVPHHTMLRIWDLLMLNGFDVLYFVAVALLKYHKTTLLSSTFERIMILLSTTLTIEDDDRLVRKVSKLYERRGRKRLVDTLKAEYRSQIK
ncbi:18919_t:CDS:10 [Acaulospora morrowiae]|uniref:18919_t:CDS:1 n=1 Tax=Acaulospora morrowiae TaxID=94023 RepID=A0A9N9A5P2_9GLOM|nr:18919_t:CDS:10 [Acaulospora morrowiae]